MFQKLWHSYTRDLPLRFKFLIINLILLISLGLISVFIFSQISQIITHNTISSQSAVVTQTGTSIEASISTVRTIMDSVSTMPFLSRIVEEKSPTASKQLTASSLDSYANDFFYSINTILDQTHVSAIRVYLEPDYAAFCTQYPDSGILRPVSDIKSSYWHGIFIGSRHYSTLLCPEFYLTGAEKRLYGRLAYIQKYEGVSETAAYLAVYFSLRELESILRQNQNGMKSVSYLINSRSNLVASSDETQTGLYHMDYDQIPEQLSNSGEFTEVDILGNKLYMSYRDIAHTDWRLVSVIPVSSISSREHTLFMGFSAFYIIIGLSLLLLELFLSNSLTQRVTHITRQLTAHKKHAPELITADPSKDEIGQLVVAYNSMSERLHTLMQTQADTAEKLKVSEVRALQAQINPHFLYNMLDMINWLSIGGNQEGVSEAILSLSRFYKLTLSQKSLTVSLRDELKHVELYVHLQNLRFDHRIQLLIDVPDELLDCEIPKLVLQPIVENAILHGICEKQSKSGDIVIMGWSEDQADNDGEDILLTVSDNGVGISPERLEIILDGGENTSPGSSSGSNIAIYNTHQRLKLIYGEPYGLHFSSVEGQGTDVEVRIPLRPFQ